MNVSKEISKILSIFSRKIINRISVELEEHILTAYINIPFFYPKFKILLNRIPIFCRAIPLTCLIFQIKIYEFKSLVSLFGAQRIWVASTADFPSWNAKNKLLARSKSLKNTGNSQTLKNERTLFRISFFSAPRTEDMIEKKELFQNRHYHCRYLNHLSNYFLTKHSPSSTTLNILFDISNILIFLHRKYIHIVQVIQKLRW